MNEVQLENGYTMLANELLDALWKIRISGEEMQMLNFILRKTYGYKKKFAEIDLKEFCDGTGKEKPNASRSIKKLIDRNIVIKNDNGELGINTSLKTWQKLSKLITPKPLSKLITKVINNDNSQLYINKKENTPISPKGDSSSRRNEKKSPDITPEYLERLINLVAKWNAARGTHFKVNESLYPNFSYWAAMYSQEEMETAVTKIKYEKFWDKIMTPQMFLRKLDQRRESVDYIGKFYNLPIPEQQEGYLTVDEAREKGVLW